MAKSAARQDHGDHDQDQDRQRAGAGSAEWGCGSRRRAGVDPMRPDLVKRSALVYFESLTHTHARNGSRRASSDRVRRQGPQRRAALARLSNTAPSREARLGRRFRQKPSALNNTPPEHPGCGQDAACRARPGPAQPSAAKNASTGGRAAQRRDHSARGVASQRRPR